MKTTDKYILEIAVCLVGIALVIRLADASGLDHWVQEFLYSRLDKRWLIQPQARDLAYLILYKGIKIALILAGVGLLSWFGFRSWKDGWDSRTTRFSIGLLAAVSVPLIAGILKKTTGVSCPAQEVFFDGSSSHVTIWSQLLQQTLSAPNLHCWPAGHASGGFALFALRLWPEKSNKQWVWLIPGLLIGWAMGFYQMARGQHYLSHTIATMLIAWAVTSLALLALARLNRQGKLPLENHST